MTSVNTLETIARDFYQLFQARNREGFAALMHADFTFTSPQDDHIDSAVFFTRCWPMGEQQTDFEIDKIAAANQYVFVHYSFVGADGSTTRNVEILTIEEDKVSSVEVYFGHAFPAAYASPSG